MGPPQAAPRDCRCDDFTAYLVGVLERGGDGNALSFALISWVASFPLKRRLEFSCGSELSPSNLSTQAPTKVQPTGSGSLLDSPQAPSARVVVSSGTVAHKPHPSRIRRVAGLFYLTPADDPASINLGPLRPCMSEQTQPQPEIRPLWLRLFLCGVDPPTATPLPGSLTLFAASLDPLGVLGWRNKRKRSLSRRNAQRDLQASAGAARQQCR